jgi:hypothetical protein
MSATKEKTEQPQAPCQHGRYAIPPSKEVLRALVKTKAAAFKFFVAASQAESLVQTYWPQDGLSIEPTRYRASHIESIALMGYRQAAQLAERAEEARFLAQQPKKKNTDMETRNQKTKTDTNHPPVSAPRKKQMNQRTKGGARRGGLTRTPTQMGKGGPGQHGSRLT